MESKGQPGKWCTSKGYKNDNADWGYFCCRQHLKTWAQKVTIILNFCEIELLVILKLLGVKKYTIFLVNFITLRWNLRGIIFAKHPIWVQEVTLNAYISKCWKWRWLLLPLKSSLVNALHNKSRSLSMIAYCICPRSEMAIYLWFGYSSLLQHC